MPGLRIVGCRRWISIAFAVEGEQVLILGIFYAGRNINTGIAWRIGVESRSGAFGGRFGDASFSKRSMLGMGSEASIPGVTNRGKRRENSA
ncbi:hypothetical protein [Mesorhizobium sp. B2-3-13]|uniref:hypothetical protein n=1 Tax=Mesorhizobium sp. B2-3-13 TaxID=2589951 RepID=UPI001FED9543|nr:hypothetical protein [Mesorhizobium sp. B2-3-13]